MNTKEKKLLKAIKEILENNPLNDATDEEITEVLLRKTSGELVSYLDPILKQEVKITSGKLVTRKMVVKFTVTIKTDI